MITQPQFTPDSLKELEQISQYTENTFRQFSKTVDSIFYEIVGESLFQNSSLEAKLSSDDVFHLKQIKEILEILHITFNQNKQ